MPANTLTPFACLVPFHVDIEIPVREHLTLEALKSLIDRTIGKGSQMLAIRIDGRFGDLTIRAFPPQFKPYTH
jgi:alpha-acetolactate decarboxylase